MRNYIVVKPNPDYLIWEEDISQCDKGAYYKASTGVRAVKVVDGVFKPQNIVKTGEEKPLFRHGESAENVKLIGMNTDLECSVFWGVSGMYFKERDTESSNVGMNGALTFKPYQFSTVVSRGLYSLRAAEVKEKIKPKIDRSAKAVFAQMTARKKYREIEGLTDSMADEIKIRLQNALEASHFNIEITSLTINGFYFDDDFLNALKADSDDRYDPLKMFALPSSEENSVSPSEKLIQSCNPATRQAASTATASNTLEANYCPGCGTPLVSGAAYCTKCGRKVF